MLLIPLIPICPGTSQFPNIYLTTLLGGLQYHHYRFLIRVVYSEGGIALTWFFSLLLYICTSFHFRESINATKKRKLDKSSTSSVRKFPRLNKHSSATRANRGINRTVSSTLLKLLRIRPFRTVTKCIYFHHRCKLTFSYYTNTI